MPSSEYYGRQADTLLTLALNATDPELSARYRSLAVEYKMLAANSSEHAVPPRSVSRLTGRPRRRASLARPPLPVFARRFVHVLGKMQPHDGKPAHNLPSMRIGKILGRRIALSRALPIKARVLRGCSSRPIGQLAISDWGICARGVRATVTSLDRRRPTAPGHLGVRKSRRCRPTNSASDRL